MDSAGNQADDWSVFAAISGDGRYVAFQSLASNLVARNTNGRADIFVHDRETGITERVSVDSAGNEADDWSGGSSISADGRYVVLYSDASNLVAGVTNGYLDVFLHDRQTGVTQWVSVGSAGDQGDDRSEWPAISADGRYVAFDSFASNLVPGDTHGVPDIFVREQGAAPVGGLADLPDVSDSSSRNYIALPGLAAAALLALSTGAWYTGRRWLR